MIEILERTGVDDLGVVGRWDEEDGWIEGGERLDFPDSEYYSEDLMLDRFSGPRLFARAGGSVDKQTPDTSIGPPHAATLADFAVVEDEGEGPDEEEDGRAARRAWEERQKSEAEDRVEVDSVADAPDDRIVHVDVDEEGDSDRVWYEP